MTSVACVEHISKVKADEYSRRRSRRHFLWCTSNILLSRDGTCVDNKFHAITCSDAVLERIQMLFENVDVKACDMRRDESAENHA